MINPVLDAIFQRRSIRAFQPCPLKKEELTLIADAARFAPSGRNLQTWQFTVVQNKQALRRLADVIARALGLDPASYCFYGADTLILASNCCESRHAVEDCACALENMFLAAWSLGIGSVWINQLKGLCDLPEVRALLTELQLPEDHLVWGMAALGYPAADPAPAVKREDVVKWVL